LANIDILKDIEIPLTLSLCDFKMTLEDLASLSKGSLVPLGLPDDHCEFSVFSRPGVPILKGEVISIDGELYFKICDPLK